GAQQVTNTTANVDMPNVQGVDELLVTMIQATNGAQLIGTRQAYAVTPTTVDLSSAQLLPYVKTVTYAPTGVSWAEEGTGTADFVIARLDVTAASTANYERIIIAPHSGMSLPLPLLTGADAMYNPSA